MKKFFLLALLFCALQAFPDTKVYLYVNTLDGVNVREEPNGKKIKTLKCNERVEFLRNSEIRSKIGEYEDNWRKIKTEDGTEGFVFGSYLSASLEAAQSFRLWDAIHPVGKWFEKWTDKFSETMYIDKNVRHITSYEREDAYSIHEDGIDFLFFPTKDRESGKTGYFLGSVDILENSGIFPESIPIKIGDSMQKVRDIFGNPNYEDNGECYSAFGAFSIVEMHIFSYRGKVDKINFSLSGW